ncbi:MAG: hypothetical protein Q4C12_02515 [Clostridia bacterium]|nr:hypothetical protein [Clostridia bacterium]
MKRLCAVLAALFVLAAAQTVFGAPEMITPGQSGTASNLIVVRKPESSSSATTRTVYGITGIGSAGVKVSYYRFDGANYIAIKNSEGNVFESSIGAAGVFYKQVTLGEGHNYFCVRAEDVYGNSQIVYFDINVLNQDILENIKAFTQDVQSVYNGWLN